LPGCDAHHQVIGGVVGKRETAAVEAVEGDQRREREPVVAVEQGVVPGE